MKSNIVSRLSLRAKFRGNSTIELVVIDHQSGTVYLNTLNFITGKLETVEEPENESNKDSEQQELIEEQLEEGN